MARRDRALLVFGTVPDKGFRIGYARADGTGGDSLAPCRGIPEGFLALRLAVSGDQVHLVGRVRVVEKGEMRGFEYHVLRSTTPAGADWENMRLPITGSLSAVDFGEDGRIWAVAAGNRLQIRRPEAPRL